MRTSKKIKKIAKILAPNWDTASEFSRSVFLFQAQKIIETKTIPKIFNPPNNIVRLTIRRQYETQFHNEGNKIRKILGLPPRDVSVIHS